MILRPYELDQADDESIETCYHLMTSEEVLSKTEFEAPQIIRPEFFPNSEAILNARLKIRDLELLPVKSPDMHKFYNDQRDDPKLVDEINSYFGDITRYTYELPNIVLASNKFTYQLPPDIEQYLVWIKYGDKYQVAKFIANCLKTMNVHTDNLVLFERSTRSATKLVKGTFKSIRHIHFWVKV